jgi:3-hydroxybutyryl-CoA dehydrogenase
MFIFARKMIVSMMKVLVIGSRNRIDEFRQLTLQGAEIDYLDQFYLDMGELEVPADATPLEIDPYFMAEVDLSTYPVIFDLNLDDYPDNLELYAANEGQLVFGCAVKQSAAELAATCPFELECKLFGINALPTFLHRPLLEWSALRAEDAPEGAAAIAALGLQGEQVGDQVGMVSARVVCMIINEAAFVLGEGTADAQAVDNAMRLGTNYPYGPFEWADKIGIDNVFELLQALHTQTGDGRYKIAPALRAHYLRDAAFQA